MKTQIEIAVDEGHISVKGPYSTSNNDTWRKLGGKFTDGRWVIPDNDTSRHEVSNLFGSKSPLVEVAVSDEHPSVFGYGSRQIGGYVLASRRGRDSRVEMPAGVSVVSGSFPSSGGSAKSPAVYATVGTVFRLTCRDSFATAMGLEKFVQTQPTVEI